MFKWIKRLFLFFLSAPLLLIVAATVKTYLKPSKQIPAGKSPDLKITDEVFNRLSSAIQIRTITYSDENKLDSNAFNSLHQHMQKSFPLVHKNLTLEIIDKHSLLYTWAGKNSNKKPIMLMAHQDVVPVEDSTQWEVPPFAGIRKNGFIYGRGTLDIKSGIYAILESVEYLIREGFQPEQTIYLAFGHDEESKTSHGAKSIAKVLEQRGIRLDFVLDEGGLILKNALPGLNKPAALIGIAEKGIVNVKITAKGKGGHSSMPPVESVVTKLAEAIRQIQKNPFPAKLDGPTKLLLEYTAPEMKFPFNVLFGNQWLTSKIILSQMGKMPSANASIRTTISVNMLKGSEKENVIPSEASAIANLRLMPGTTEQDVITHFNNCIIDKDVLTEIIPPFQPASKISSVKAPGFLKIRKAIETVFPETVSAPFQLVAVTDSRNFASIADNIYRFHPAIYEKQDLERIHGVNERISEDNYRRTIEFYYFLVRSLE